MKSEFFPFVADLMGYKCSFSMKSGFDACFCFVAELMDYECSFSTKSESEAFCIVLVLRLGITERKQDAAYFSSFLDEEEEEIFGDYDTLEEKSEDHLDLDHDDSFQSRKLLSLDDQQHCDSEECNTAEEGDDSEMAPRCQQLVDKAEALWRKLKREGSIEVKAEEMEVDKRLGKVGSLLSGVEESKALLEEYQASFLKYPDGGVYVNKPQVVKDSLMDGSDHRVCQPLLRRTIQAIKSITRGAVWAPQLSSLLKVKHLK